MPDGYRLFVSMDRTRMVRVWDDTTQAIEVCTRETPAHIWGPPTVLYEEREPAYSSHGGGGDA
jgi:hypothetical protein